MSTRPAATRRGDRAFLPSQDPAAGQWNETYQAWIDAEVALGDNARERIMRAASLAFYRWGIRAMTVDHVIVLSRVSKMTFYRNFPSKSELIEAVLERWIAYTQEQVYACVRPREKTVLQAFDELVDSIVFEVSRPFFNGSIIANVFREFGETQHPVHALMQSHYEWAVGVLEELLARLQIARARLAAEQLLMIHESVSAAVADQCSLNARTQLRFMGAALLLAHRPELACEMREHDEARLNRLRQRARPVSGI